MRKIRSLVSSETSRAPSGVLLAVKDVFVADIQSDGTFVNVTRIVDDLPEAGEHADRQAEH